MREDQFDITVSVDGEQLGTFDTCDGGDGDSDETKYRPGAMGKQRVYGGPTTVGNVTVGRVLEQITRDDVALSRRIYVKRGRAKMVVTKQPLDVDGNPFGQPFVWSGILKTCTLPKADSNSSAIAVWALVLSTQGEMN